MDYTGVDSSSCFSFSVRTNRQNWSPYQLGLAWLISTVRHCARARRTMNKMPRMLQMIIETTRPHATPVREIRQRLWVSLGHATQTVSIISAYHSSSTATRTCCMSVYLANQFSQPASTSETGSCLLWWQSMTTSVHSQMCHSSSVTP